MQMTVINVDSGGVQNAMLAALAVCKVGNIEPHSSLAVAQAHVDQCAGCAAQLDKLMQRCREYDRFDEMAGELQELFKRMDERDEHNGDEGEG